jgi:RNA-binding protein NOB1
LDVSPITASNDRVPSLDEVDVDIGVQSNDSNTTNDQLKTNQSSDDKDLQIFQVDQPKPSSSQSRILKSRNYGNEAMVEDIAHDNIGWISKDNIHSQSMGLSAIDKQKGNCDVVCMTTDFAMQNVLIQLGLRIASSDGMLIKSVKQWVLRCNGCYKVHYDMQRLFCSKCGLNYLSKVGCHIDASTGELKLHLKKNFHHNLKGKKYSLPSPDKRDRFEGDLLLREDQLFSGIWRQKSHTIRKNIVSAFGEDITSDVGISINKGLRVAVGYGAKNPNAERGRERRGKTKSK